MKKYDVTVIGGGISGLLMAGLLTVKGFSVCLLESGPRVGGYFQNITSDKVPYGAHHIAIPNRGIFEELFQSLNITLSTSLIPADKVTIFYNRERYLISLELEEMKENLIRYFPDQRNQISHFVDYLHHFSSALNDGKQVEIKQFFMENVFKSFEELLNSYFESEQLKGVLSAIGPSYADVYPEDSAFTYLSLLATYGSGTYYIEQYGELLVKELTQIIDHGTSAIKYRYKAKKLVEEGNGYIILNEKEERLYTDKVVIACYPVDLLQTLPQKTKIQNKLIAKMSELKIGSSAWRYYFKVNKRLGNHEYIYHHGHHRSVSSNGDLQNFIISTMDQSEGKINVMATIVAASISETEILPKIKAEILMLLDIDDNDLEYCATIGKQNRENLTLNKKGSVFGWSRDVKGNLHTNLFKSVHKGWNNVHVVGHWSSTFGIYGSVLTVLDTIPEVIN